MKNVIEFKDVGLNFGGVKALDGISFEVKEGSLFSIIGPNGAGKTSVFNCINGIYRPTSGEIKIFDKSIKDMKPDDIANMGVSRTFQNIELFENMTALDNILIGAHKHINYGAVSSLFRTKKVRIQEDEARNIAEDVIDFLEIEDVCRERKHGNRASAETMENLRKIKKKLDKWFEPPKEQQ